MSCACTCGPVVAATPPPVVTESPPEPEPVAMTPVAATPAATAYSAEPVVTQPAPSDRIAAAIAAATGATPAGTAPANVAYIRPGASTTGKTPLAAGPHSTATPGRIEVLTPADQGLVDAALAQLAKSPSGAPVLAALQQYGVKIEVLSDAEFEAQGEGANAAVYDPRTDVMSVRRSWLQQNPAKTASLIAHEGMHAVDDASGLTDGVVQQRVAAASSRAGASGTQAVELAAQARWEASIAREARGYVVQGQVLRELGQDDPAKMAGAVLIAARGGNDAATYDAVFRSIVESGEGGYNADGRTVAPFVV